MIFSIVTIMVYGMSIIFYIMSEMMRSPVDREKENQTRKYLKEYEKLRSSAMREEEQRIRAKLLQLSILGSVTRRNSMQATHRRASRIGKNKNSFARRASRINKPNLTRCLTANSSGDTSPRVSRISTALKESDILTFQRGYEPTYGGSEDSYDTDSEEEEQGESCPLIETQNSENTTRSLTSPKTQMNSLCEEISSFDPIILDVDPGESSQYPSANPYLYEIPVDSSKMIEEPAAGITKWEEKLITTRRRKRSGHLAPKEDCLDMKDDPSLEHLHIHGARRKPKIYHKRASLHISRDPSTENLQRNYSDSGLPSLVNRSGINQLPRQPARNARLSLYPSNVNKYGEEDTGAKLLPDVSLARHQAHYTNAENAHVSSEDVKPNRKHQLPIPRGKLTKYRRTQSFRFRDKKRLTVRKGSLDPVSAHKDTHENIEPITDSQFVRSLSCRRRDRENRISTLCLKQESDSGSSNDLILPAITKTPDIDEENEQYQLRHTRDDTKISETLRKDSVPSSRNQDTTSVTRSHESVRLLSIEDHYCEDQHSVSLSSKPSSNPQKQKQRRSGLINVQYKRHNLQDMNLDKAE
ncbi:hypothetical protein SNE40_021651 [Patella caerulea]|uniref:Uncharacterized protein n=1 Tax=Patella caerulea TaxID=87958 RepID=A0AAN8GCU3_PATCE